METLELTRCNTEDISGNLYQDNSGNFYTDCFSEPEHGKVGRVYRLSPPKSPDGEPDIPFDGVICFTNPPTDMEKLEKTFRFEYMMLGKLNDNANAYFNRPADCRYRNDRAIGGIKETVEEMKELWNKIPDGIKPEWCTWEQILEYERMASA